MRAQRKRLLFSQTLINRNVTRLQVQLRRLYREYKRTPNVAKSLVIKVGDELIYRAYRQMQDDVKAYVERRGLRYEGDNTELNEGLKEMLETWRGIVDDF